jgi:hypothetical protein
LQRSKTYTSRGADLTTTTNSTIDYNKGFTEGNSQSLIRIKKLHRISNKTLVIIDESIIDRIGIDDKENTWVEEVVTEDGILLKICNNNIDAGGSSR